MRVQAVAADAGVPAKRLGGRRKLLAALDRQRPALDRAAEVETFNAHQQCALNLLTGSATARAFNLSAEPAAVRARYGRSAFGQRCVLARRLAEAGVPVINVHYCLTPQGSWDTHGRHFPQMKDSLCPTFDRAFAGLIEDLAQRGLLGQTLVLATAEFGRTPKINRAGGRDHWPWVYSVALAGGGARPAASSAPPTRSPPIPPILPIIPPTSSPPSITCSAWRRIRSCTIRRAGHTLCWPAN